MAPGEPVMLNRLLDAAQEQQAVIVAPEDRLAPRSTVHHVMPRTRPVEPSRTRHAADATRQRLCVEST